MLLSIHVCPSLIARTTEVGDSCSPPPPPPRTHTQKKRFSFSERSKLFLCHNLYVTYRLQFVKMFAKRHVFLHINITDVVFFKFISSPEKYNFGKVQISGGSTNLLNPVRDTRLGTRTDTLTALVLIPATEADARLMSKV